MPLTPPRSYRKLTRIPRPSIHVVTDRDPSLGTILIGTCSYGIGSTGPWLPKTMEVMFWIYVALSTFASAGIYLTLWSTLSVPPLSFILPGQLADFPPAASSPST